MGTVTDLNEFRKKKEIEEERKIARELHELLSDLMFDDEPVIVTYEDSDGVLHTYNLDELSDLSDSNS